jgi:uncharacterized membrane protein
MFIKIVVVALLLAVVISLTSGMVFLVKDKGQGNRTVKALTFRIGLSLLAFFVLIVSYYAGWIEPHGLIPTP